MPGHRHTQTSHRRPGAGTTSGGRSDGPNAAVPEALGVVVDDIRDYAVFMLDLGGRIASWNSGAARLKGYTPEEAIGKPFAMLFTPEDVALGKPQREMAIARKNGVYQGEGHRVRKDGSRFHAEVTLRLLRDEGDRPRGFVKVTRDISERRRLQEIEATRMEVAEQLLGIVSHDLRNPLNAILMSATLLLARSTLAPREIRALTRIVSSAERATRLVADLLDYTQSRLGGGLSITPQPLDVHEFCGQVVEEIRLTHPGRLVVMEPSGEGAVQWDPDRIAQLLTNLVNNAISHAVPERPVRVSTRAEQDVVVIEVHNWGEPIAPELLPRLFEPLSQGERSGSGSIGFGLFIAHKVVEGHGGTLNVQSSAERGTTFTARLPRLPPDRHPEGAAGHRSFGVSEDTC